MIVASRTSQTISALAQFNSICRSIHFSRRTFQVCWIDWKQTKQRENFAQKKLFKHFIRERGAKRIKQQRRTVASESAFKSCNFWSISQVNLFVFWMQSPKAWCAFIIESVPNGKKNNIVLIDRQRRSKVKKQKNKMIEYRRVLSTKVNANSANFLKFCCCWFLLSLHTHTHTHCLV